MKSADIIMVEDIFSLSYTEFCVRNLTAQALESELDDVILYAQRYGASEHIEVLNLVAIMPWEVPAGEYQQVNTLREFLPQCREYQRLSDADRKALDKAFKAIEKGL